MPSIPYDTIELIIDTLAKDDIASVKQCSLACHDFLPLCRKHIFRSIAINKKRYQRHMPRVLRSTFEGFHRLLQDSPEIALYVRQVVYYTRSGDFSHSWSASIFPKLVRLESAEIIYNPPGHRPFNWDSYQSRLVLLPLLHLPTLTRCRMFTIGDFRVPDLAFCSGLRELEVSSVGATQLDAIVFDSTPPNIPIQLERLGFGRKCSGVMRQLCSVRHADGRHIIDLLNLKAVSIFFSGDEDIPVAQRLLGHCEQLASISIDAQLYTLTALRFSQSIRPSWQTLRQIKISMRVGGDLEQKQQISSLAHELDEMSSQNSVELIDIRVSFEAESSYAYGEQWGALDRALAMPGWPDLRRVMLSVAVRRHRWAFPDGFEQGLNGLPQTQLNGLASSKRVVFEFSVNAIQGPDSLRVYT